MKWFLKNKKGMTYVELLVAFTLLMVIIVSFTPMLLKSYESIYNAGELSGKNYTTKTELEQGLSRRVSTDLNMVNVGLGNFVNNIPVVGRRLTSTMQGAVETLFYGAQPRIDLISPRTVNDDKLQYDIVLQVTNISFNKVVEGDINDLTRANGTYNNGAITGNEHYDAAGRLITDANGVIYISVMMPNKSAGVETSGDDVNVYAWSNSDYGCEIVKKTSTSSSGATETSQFGYAPTNAHRITFTIKGKSKDIDFTRSPIKIVAAFKNERGQLKTAACYMYIKAPTVIATGKSSEGAQDYYTSTGVTTKVDGTQTVVDLPGNALPVQARTMTTENTEWFGSDERPSTRSIGFDEDGVYSKKASVNTDTPVGFRTDITDIAFIPGDSAKQLDDSYVMTGTNGAIYRMYCFTGSSTMMDANGDGVKDSDTLYTVVTGNASNRKTTDKVYYNVEGYKIYPSLWSGDATDQYSFQTAFKSNTYGVDTDTADDDEEDEQNNFDCSFLTRYRGQTYTVNGTNYTTFGTQARYSMVFSGYKTDYNYLTARGRRLSYVLTEQGDRCFRLAGKLNGDEDYIGYNSRWENDCYYGKGGGQNLLHITSQPYTTDARPVYFKTNKGDGGTSSNEGVSDYHYAALFMKSYTSINPSAFSGSFSDADNLIKGAFWCPWDTDADMAQFDAVLGIEVFGRGKKHNFRYDKATGQNKSETDVAGDVRGTNTIGADGNLRDEKYGMADWVQSNYAKNVTLTSATYMPTKNDGQVVYFGTVPSYALIMQHDAKNDSNYNKYTTPTRVWNGNNNPNMPATVYYVNGRAGGGTDIYRYSGTSGMQTVYTPADPGVVTEPRYATWIPADRVGYEAERYADPVPAQYATWVAKQWIPTTWQNGTGPNLLPVKARVDHDSKVFGVRTGYELIMYDAYSGAHYSWDWLKSNGYFGSDNSFWYLDADGSRNAGSINTTNGTHYLNALSLETEGDPINLDDSSIFPYKHKCDDADTRDKFPANLKKASYDDWAYFYLIQNGSDHVNAGDYGPGEYWVNSSGERVNVRSDIAGVDNMIEKTGPGYWKDSNGNLVTVRSASDLSTYYSSSDTVAVGGSTIYTGSSGTSWGSPHTSGSVNARSVGNMIVGTGKGNWNPHEDNYDHITGIINGTNTWGDENGDPVAVRSASDLANNYTPGATVVVPAGATVYTGGGPTTGGTPHTAGQVVDARSVTNMIVDTGNGHYDVQPTPESTVMVNDSTLNDSGKVQEELQKGIASAKAAAAASSSKGGRAASAEESFYNTFRDHTTRLYEDTDLEFTFGYCSNWLMSTGTVTIETSAEMNNASNVAKSYENLYLNSHTAATQGNTTAVDNLFYDVWFPGEFYNLTTASTRAGLTVACGYAVSGSAFQAQPVKDNAGNPIVDGPNDGGGNEGGTNQILYSTALGSIYNDGVLAIYKSDATLATGSGARETGIFDNILYYKATSFKDTDSITHSRKNIRFTAVDLCTSENADNTLSYYALFGDNSGNVYYEEVATASKGSEEQIGDETYTAQNVEPKQITYGNSGLNVVFTMNGEITKIVCTDDLAIVVADGGKQFAIGYRSVSDDGTVGKNWTWKKITLNNANIGTINDVCMLDDYYYFVGSRSTNTKNAGGYMLAIGAEDLRAIAKSEKTLSIGSAAAATETVAVGYLGTTDHVLYNVAAHTSV